MNNQTVIGSNNTTREKFASGSDNVDESWALALLEEALEGSFPQESNGSSLDSNWEQDAITVDESESEAFEAMDASSSSPSAIEKQQADYELKRIDAVGELSNSCNLGLIARFKALFSGR